MNQYEVQPTQSDHRDFRAREDQHSHEEKEQQTTTENDTNEKQRKVLLKIVGLHLKCIKQAGIDETETNESE